LEGGINLFIYALNNPVNLIDPYGLQESPDSHLDWFSRALSVNGGPPAGINPPPLTTPAQSAALGTVLKTGAAAAVGVTVGTLSGSTVVGVWTFWGIDAALSFLTGGPITDKWFGIDFINPPYAHAPESKNDPCLK
jgi:hypothetical protein